MCFIRHWVILCKPKMNGSIIKSSLGQRHRTIFWIYLALNSFNCCLSSKRNKLLVEFILIFLFVRNFCFGIRRKKWVQLKDLIPVLDSCVIVRDIKLQVTPLVVFIFFQVIIIGVIFKPIAQRGRLEGTIDSFIKLAYFEILF